MPKSNHKQVSAERNAQGTIKNWKPMFRAIQAQRKSGISIQEACTIHDISCSTFYEWQLRLKKAKAITT